MHIKQAPFGYGYNSITEIDGKNSEMMMNFGIIKLREGQVWNSSDESLERVFLLLSGVILFEWEEQKFHASRESCFDDPPICLHVPRKMDVIIRIYSESEIIVLSAENDNDFEPRLYDNCRDVYMGQGTMGETSTRIVRTIFDASTAPYSKLVIGEDINFPGKWSSYPPHHHPQPEIYFYKFKPENGYGHSEEGDNVYKVMQNQTVAITPGLTHSQCAAPGYAMYYCWMIRNLKDNPFGPRIYIPEHQWVMEPDADIWTGTK